MTAVVGASITLRFEIARPDGTLYDPEAGTGIITLRSPSQAIDAGTPYVIGASGEPIERIELGVFEITFDGSEGGRWRWRVDSVEGEGDAARHDVGEGSFSISFSRVISSVIS